MASFGNAHSWIGAEGARGWIQIEFPEPSEVQRSSGAAIAPARAAIDSSSATASRSRTTAWLWTTVGTQEGRKGAVAARVYRHPRRQQGYDLDPGPVRGLPPVGHRLR